MNLPDEALPGLRALLMQADVAARELASREALIPPAAAAASRLDGQIAAVDRELEALASRRLPPDAERVAALVSGSEVPQPPAADIEAGAQRVRIREGQRRQLVHDVVAVRAHIAALQAAAAKAAGALSKAEGDFATALGMAVVDAYQQAAIAFVESVVPALYSASDYVRCRTGEVASWLGKVGGGPHIRWVGPSTDERDPMNYGAFKHEMVNLWPRTDGKLATGAPVIDPDVVHAMIDQLRAPEPDTIGLIDGTAETPQAVVEDKATQTGAS